MEQNKMEAKKNVRREGGFILITGFWVIVVLTILLAAYFARHFSFMNLTERHQNRVIAFNMAEAGVSQMIETLKQTSSAVLSLSSNDAGLAIDYTPLGTQGGYAVSVTTPDISKPLLKQIISTGYTPSDDPAARAFESRTLTVYVQITEISPFVQAIFGANNLDMSGFAHVDSYDSRDGSYDDATAGQNGNLRTNATASGAVHLQGGELLYEGSIMVGPEADPNEVVSMSGSVNITGSLSSAPDIKEYQSVQVPSSLTSSGSLSLSGNTTYTIPAGTYVYDSIDIKGNATLVTTGPVTIYLKGNFSVSGLGTVQVAGSTPSNFTVAVTSAGDVDFSSNSLEFHGALYAPDSDVQISNNAQIFGAVIADIFKQSGHSEFHYDEALADLVLQIPSTENAVEVLSWTENPVI